MSFANRREILFVYSVKDANPNGDPLNANHPRFDEDTEQVLVSDVRIKRTIRDQWLREGKPVFVDGEPKTLKGRFEELKKETGLATGREIMASCLDTRLFGVTFALGKESFSWTGPVQFKWGRSLHAVTVDFVQGTSAFTTEGREGQEKQQRSFRNEYKVPFALIAVYGIANQHASERTGASGEDLELLREALWTGTENLITRSKNEHMPRFYLEIVYRPGFAGKIGSLDEKVVLINEAGEPLSKDEGRALRNLKGCRLDMTELVRVVDNFKEHIESIVVRRDRDLEVQGLSDLKGLGLKTNELQG
ncbi:type I-B CRISPR-associated protein Cas7/Csh2 [Desulfallas sp. Bu1-1]|uniref:type I-B CRISPR-associated protein Cas7/Csh2 n=1 Tax=Desulfallas sp. Bu1-1 TaxID=2787620 RepID=UPI00189D6B01|nr:type I-B CRISPR-associated protein Cas7/Csh2 [Desulfallas sp. Bu1-1]MBF7082175.1 type I-B CRISPR-associated protein Cas7/Csh2 [Desulfallas sp. Bu1-1]